LTAIVVLVLAPLAAAGQPGVAQWTVPRTPDGQSDLQGVWSFATITPLERPSRHAGRHLLPAEAVAQENQTAATRASSDRRGALSPDQDVATANTPGPRVG